MQTRVYSRWKQQIPDINDRLSFPDEPSDKIDAIPSCPKKDPFQDNAILN
ncbi:MAG: hypothetical protein OEZ34_02840 [Spirochaetia bacterium]|nr:hypothetical protein [Spirochaetia bacterium]